MPNFCFPKPSSNTARQAVKVLSFFPHLNQMPRNLEFLLLLFLMGKPRFLDKWLACTAVHISTIACPLCPSVVSVLLSVGNFSPTTGPHRTKHFHIAREKTKYGETSFLKICRRSRNGSRRLITVHYGISSNSTTRLTKKCTITPFLLTTTKPGTGPVFM